MYFILNKMDIHERNEKKLKSQIEEELIEDEFYK
jgi:hypothetical protein